jgi:hypothetical protein
LKIVVWGLCAVITALFSACPPYLPEKVQIRTEPAIYLPLGTPDSIQDNLDFPINDLAKNMPSFSAEGGGEIASYDYLGYGDIQAFIIGLKLLEKALELPENISKENSIPSEVSDTGGLSTLPEGLPDELSYSIAPSNLPDGIEMPATPTVPDIDPITIQLDSIEGETESGIDLSSIQNVLGDYDGLKFRSIPVYLYVSGPDKIFTNDEGESNVTISITAVDKSGSTDTDAGTNTELMEDTELLTDATVNSQEFPEFPAENESMKELSSKPKTHFDLADILNLDNPPSNLGFKYKIDIEPITVELTELETVKDDFTKNPLSVMLVVLLPLQFDVTKDVPILSEKNDDPDAKAIPFPEEGQDLFGRVSEDDEGSASMKDILDILRSLRIDINIENNIGFAGYAPIYKGKPDTADEEKNRLGEISLSGLSSVSLSRSEIAYPLNIWIEMYLGEGQNFEIKRLPEDTEALPLNLSLSITVETHIDKTF